MMTESNEELIKAQNQVIGVLFEVIKRLQANNDLDEEYFQIVGAEIKSKEDTQRLDNILKERKDNAKTVSRLLDQLES